MDSFVYEPMLCELTYVCALASARTWNLLVFTSTYAHKYTYIILQILLYMNSMLCKSHMSVPLRVLTLRTSLYTYIYSQVYIFHITNTFVYDSMLCELTYVCARASAHTLRLKTSLYTYILTCKVEMTIDLMCAGKWRGPHSWFL